MLRAPTRALAIPCLLAALTVLLAPRASAARTSTLPRPASMYRFPVPDGQLLYEEPPCRCTSSTPAWSAPARSTTHPAARRRNAAERSRRRRGSHLHRRRASTDALCAKPV